MTAVAQTLALGILVGVVFGLARIVPPAPPTWAGVAGIVGIVAGWQLAGWMVDRFG